MTKTLWIAALGAVLITLSAGAQPSSSSEAQKLMSRVDTEGGKNVLSKLWVDPDRFNALLRPVEAGDTEWFEVWVDLYTYSDAAVSEAIN